ncbi:MAG: class I SAM-dependent methyltransferase, partial [bacterium]
MNAFQKYAQFYDLFYNDKDYQGEAVYIHEIIQKYAPGTESILDLGSGTGSHAIFLVQEGYTVHGVDISARMLQKALERQAALPEEQGKRLKFSEGDIRALSLGTKYDAVIALFHVMSYQVHNSDLQESFSTVKAHLKPGGLFIFDCWYGPAVLSDLPGVSHRDHEDGDTYIERIGEPVIHPTDNIVEMNYSFTIKEKDRTDHFSEVHRMRYLFKPEVELLLDQVGLK